ncbi:Unknown protein sequence [Pseudomonas amygdali pv. lachrymans]|nr:Unknown protein sequence [Pseudomonas amygdali pv. lachrymans]
MERFTFCLPFIGQGSEMCNLLIGNDRSESTACLSSLA